MRTISNNALSIPTFSVDDIKDDSIAVEDKPIIERLVKNMVLVENGISLLDIYDIKTFDGTVIEKAAPKAIEVESFYISKYTITQKEWELVMGYDPSEYDVQDKNLPVFNVEYEDCLRFIAKLNRITGLKFDLPTPAQWDYAAHGGRTNSFHLEGKSYEEISGYAWLDVKQPFPVGLKYPNTLDLYDMFGNIGEICKRVEDKDIIKGGASIQRYRIWSSGGYYHYEDYWSEKNYSSSHIGFRLVCNDVDIKSLL